MKIKLYTAAALISASSLLSCAGSDNTDYTDKSLVNPAAEKKASEPVVTDTVPGTNPAGISPIITQPGITTTQSTPVSMNTQTAQPTAPGMNPAHGQPNHRCDIAVGAPLNSKPAAPAATTAPAITQVSNPPIQATPVPMNTQTTAPQTTTAPGMNPAHGEPNHRCDIAVGAPLNSKPAAPATTQAAATNAPIQTTPVPMNTQTTAPQTVTAPGMNPAHGQPNHRCDIAVGAPLNSKPTVTSAPKSDSGKH